MHIIIKHFSKRLYFLVLKLNKHAYNFKRVIKLNVAFVKLKKFEKLEYNGINSSLNYSAKELKNNIINLENWIKEKIYNRTNFIKLDEHTNTVYVSNFNRKTIKKLNKILIKNKYDYAITENDANIRFNTIESRMITKYLLPEIKKYIFQITKPVLDEVYICVNEYNNENISIILDMMKACKAVNVITENNRYYYLEKQMESKQNYFNVSSNKRKSLKKAYFTINIDFKNFNGFNLNRNMIIVDVNSNINVPMGFNGIIIRKCKINTQKALRIFSEFENFNKEKLIDYELLKCHDYNTAREKIKMDKIYIENLYNNRIIDIGEIKRTRPAVKQL